MARRCLAYWGDLAYPGALGGLDAPDEPGALVFCHYRPSRYPPFFGFVKVYINNQKYLVKDNF